MKKEENVCVCMKRNLPRQEVKLTHALMRCNRPQTTHDIPTKTFNESRPKKIVPTLIINLITLFRLDEYD